jgi:hypothetical protein
MKLTAPLLLLACLLTACSSTTPRPLSFGMPVFVAPTAPDKGKSTLVLYRASEKPVVAVPTVMVDGRILFSPAERDYTWAHLPVGTHRIVVDWPAATDWPDLAFEVELVEGSPLYLKLSGSYQRRDTYEGVAGSTANAMPPKAALGEIQACCRYVPHMGGF